MKICWSCLLTDKPDFPVDRLSKKTELPLMCMIHGSFNFSIDSNCFFLFFTSIELNDILQESNCSVRCYNSRLDISSLKFWLYWRRLAYKNVTFGLFFRQSDKLKCKCATSRSIFHPPEVIFRGRNSHECQTSNHSTGETKLRQYKQNDKECLSYNENDKKSTAHIYSYPPPANEIDSITYTFNL